MLGIDLKQHDKQDGRHLGERVRLAKNTGAKIAESRDGVQHAADKQDADVAAKDQHRVLPRNQVHYRQHEKYGAEQQLVSDGVEILAEQCLLMEATSKQSVKPVA